MLNRQPIPLPQTDLHYIPKIRRINLWPTNGMNPATGYGRMEIGLAKALKKAGVIVNLALPQWQPSADVLITVGSPEWGQKLPKGTRAWCWTMSESTRPSHQWVTAMNRYFERVLVPCPPLVEYYKTAGVTTAVEYVPLGVDDTPPSVPPHCDGEGGGGLPETFVWLAYSLGDMRKAVEHALFAFKRVHGGDERFKMVIKCRDNPQFLTGLEDPQVELVRGETSTEAYHALLARCHAMVFPSRGEGFGLPPREAVLSGMPVIATEWLGMWDAAQWGYALPVKEMRPCQFDEYTANAEGALWSEPDWGRYDAQGKVIPGALDALMQQIVQDYPAALAKAKVGRAYLLREFGWNKAVQRILSLLG